MFPSSGNTAEDQKASFGLSYQIPRAGLELFGELGIDDFTPGGFSGYLRYPLHTLVYVLGARKIINISVQKSISGELIVEANWFEMSQDYQFAYPYTFYFHHIIKQGYTNKGQLLGNAASPGGNSQYLGFVVYYPKGSSNIFITRNNPDNNFLYKQAIYPIDTDLNNKLSTNSKANFVLGLATSYFFSLSLSSSFLFTYNLIINQHYIRGGEAVGVNKNNHNFSLHFTLKYQL
jgi:hypothetical protein